MSHDSRRSLAFASNFIFTLPSFFTVLGLPRFSTVLDQLPLLQSLNCFLFPNSWCLLFYSFWPVSSIHGSSFPFSHNHWSVSFFHTSWSPSLFRHSWFASFVNRLGLPPFHTVIALPRAAQLSICPKLYSFLLQNSWPTLFSQSSWSASLFQTFIVWLFFLYSILSTPCSLVQLGVYPQLYHNIASLFHYFWSAFLV